MFVVWELKFKSGSNLDDAIEHCNFFYSIPFRCIEKSRKFVLKNTIKGILIPTVLYFFEMDTKN